MVKLDFNNYVISKSESKFNSHNAFTNVQAVNQNINREFTFAVNPLEERVVAQARLFARYFLATSVYEQTVQRYPSRTSDNEQLLTETYIYSYIKSLFYAYGTVNRTPAMMGKRNNLVFKGHKILNDCIVEGYIQHFSPPGKVTSMMIEIDNNSEKQFENWEIWNKIYSPDINQVFNPNYEAILSTIKAVGGDVADVEKLGAGVNPCDNLLKLPLGNSAYSNDMNQLLFIESNSVISDKPSYYWGKAVFLKVESVPIVDIDDSLYDTVFVSDLDPFSLTYEVESITGFNPLSGPMTAFNQTTGLGPDDTIPPSRGRGKNFKPGGGGSQRGNTAMGVSASSINPIQSASNSNSFKNRITKFGKDALNVVKQVDALLDDDRTQILAGIISDITGKNVKPKSLKRHVGSRIGSVLQQFGIAVDYNIRSDDEHGYYYVETEQHGKNYKAIISGAPEPIDQIDL
jgi:hypothetical protein